jgi:hypothetical protein
MQALSRILRVPQTMAAQPLSWNLGSVHGQMLSLRKGLSVRGGDAAGLTGHLALACQLAEPVGPDQSTAAPEQLHPNFDADEFASHAQLPPVANPIMPSSQRQNVPQPGNGISA